MRCVANECRNVCGEISSATPARSAAALITSHAFCRESAWPRRPRKSAGVADPRAARIGRTRTRYASTARRAKDPTGTIRCLPPLPSTRTSSAAAPSAPSTSSTVSAVISLTRAPVAYSSSSRALSRTRSGSSPSVASRIRPIVSMETAFGRRLGSLGGLCSADTSTSTMPSSTRKRWKLRTLDSMRASDDAVRPPCSGSRTRCAKAAMCAALASAGSATPSSARCAV